MINTTGKEIRVKLIDYGFVEKFRNSKGQQIPEDS
jgi:hypothetical protein